MLDSRPKGRGFEPHRRRCVVSLSKNINPSLVLVQPRKTRPFITEKLLMGRKESNQTNKLITESIPMDPKHSVIKVWANEILVLSYIKTFFKHPGPEVIKLFSYSTQLSMKFTLLINVKMPTIVGILTIISMINTVTTSERLNTRNFFICHYFSFYEQLKFCAQLSQA